MLENDRGMKQMKVVASEEPNGASLSFDFKNGLICGLILVIILLSGIVYGMANTDAPAVPLPQQNPNKTPTIPQEISNGPMQPDKSKPMEPGPFDIQAVRTKALHMEKMIIDYYGDATWETMLKQGLGVPHGSADEQSGLEYVSRNIIKALLLKKKYVIGTIGSSVAAGHDNCNYDSYERQLQRLLSPLWKAAGSDIEVRNAGEGGSCGDSHSNQVFCIVQNVGSDVDLVHYSWTYFEGRGAGIKEHEMFTSMVTDDGQEPCSEPAKHGRRQKLLSRLREYNGNGKYTGKHWGQIGDGLHNITRYGESETEKIRRDSLGVVWRNWHPGPLGFQAVSDVVAYNHLKALKYALKEIENMHVKLNRFPTVSDFPYFKSPLMSADLPNPLICDPLICQVEEPPGCLNLEKPTYGYHQVSIVDKPDTLNPYSGQILTESEGGWKIKYTSPSAKLIPKAERGRKECSHLDSCGYVEAQDSKAQWLAFKLPKMSLGMVVVCGCCGKSVAHKMFLNNSGLSVEFDGKPLAASTFTQWPNSKCARVIEKFPKGVKDPGGHIYLGIRLTDTANKVAISHIITL